MAFFPVGLSTSKDAIRDVLTDLPEQEVGKDQYSFSIKFSGCEVTDGQQIPPSQAQKEPHFSTLQPETHRYKDREFGKMFTLMCIDLDPPSPAKPSAREWLHWMRSSVFADKAVPGQTPCSWQGPCPPEGNHRYVFLMYEQKKPLAIRDFELDTMRKNFNHHEFAIRHGLQGPIASLFFYSQKEASEPASH